MIPPLAVHVASASPHETKLVGPTIERRFLAESPEWLIGDCAYDSDPLDVQMRERFGVQLGAPHKCTPESHARWPRAAAPPPPPLEDRALVRLAS
ncbi:MAG TPA: hypothetical protein VN879_14555 [Candidatus Acidoferrales bacterium]|nr:hypothetical protein [Candidatus Acidoferrales bacterium]